MQPVIGLEIHIQLKTESKLFCSCSASAFGAPPNSNICEVCTGQPGVLPVLNKKAVQQLLTLALIAGCRIQERSIFARKNYFYPDLPKNYQISQYETPIALGGALHYWSGGVKKICKLTRIHIEEDAGKLLHAIGSETLDYSLVDFNRCGCALAEMVTEPEIASPQEASDFLVALRNTLRSAGISSCDMEKGEMRVDVNISLKKDDGSFGTRVEIKNLNSFKSVRDALDYEINRQRKAREAGETVIQETRLWDVRKNQTIAMRSKEGSSDYRYFPEPDLPPLVIAPEWIEEIRKSLPTPVHQKVEIYQQSHGLTLKEAQAILFNEDPGIPALYEAVIAALKGGTNATAKAAAHWILNDLLGALKTSGKTLEETGLNATRLLEFLQVVEEKKLSSKIAKDIFSQILADPAASAASIVEKSGLTVLTDEKDLISVVHQVIAEKEKVVRDYKGGKDSALQALIGAAMAKTRGQAHPGKLKELFEKKLRG